MRILIFGATGLLGQALLREGRGRGVATVGAARRGADRDLDLLDMRATLALIEEIAPDVVVNAAAISNIDECEKDPGTAYLVNARAVAAMAQSCGAERRLVHVSTDHFFTGNGRRRHDESAPVHLVNEYARTKLAAESFALTAPDALVVRTNIAGFRGWPQPTFFEWAIDALRHRKPMTLFPDYFTSTIDARALARIMFDLIERRATGLLNVASRDVSSKREFVEALAKSMRIDIDWASEGSVKGLAVPRAESVGLDVTRAETILGAPMPGLEAVIASLAKDEQRP